NQIEWAYFGIDGQPIVKDGYHILKNEYDDKGNQIEWAYFGIDGQPIVKDGYHILKNEYDDKGNQIEWAYFGIDEQPILHRDGNHIFKTKYDDKGNQTEWAYFGIDGQPIVFKDGYHILRNKYDDKGNETEWAYFGLDGQPIVFKDGYHILRNKYDDKGNETEWAYFGLEGQPILLKEGYHISEYKYDDKSNDIERAYFGVDGQPVLHKDGYHILRNKYDDKGNETEWAYFGVDGKPTLHKDGNHIFKAEYDDKGNQTEWAYFGVDEQPVLHKDGYHIFKAEYDGKDNQIEWIYFGLNNEPVFLNSGKDKYHKSTGKWDERGNRIEYARFGINNEPILDKEGWHKVILDHDLLGNIIKEATYGVDGLPNMAYGYHLLKKKYNALGKNTEQSYFDDKKQPMLHRDGYHKITYKYNAKDKITEKATFNIHGLPTRVNMASSTKETSIYRQDEVTLWKSIFEGMDESLGFTRFTIEYNLRGKEERITFSDKNGNPAYSKEKLTETTQRFGDEYGYNEVLMRYDNSGYFIGHHYIGFNEKRVYEQLVIDYDFRFKEFVEKNLPKMWKYFDAEGKPTVNENGSHKVTKDYIHWSEMKEYGYFYVTIDYDKNEQPTQATYYSDLDEILSTEIHVVSVVPDSQGEKLDIQANDILTHYDGKPIFDLYKFIYQRNQESENSPAKPLTIQRENETLTFMVKPGQIGIQLENKVVEKSK
ncbi:hypothetical protein QUF74_19400, partial [Candidatus Halobeggiatoa sp. HSG11]|nr:hypothetical protein [Candidatus Halobeggiatoa sp. HSG11]